MYRVLQALHLQLDEPTTSEYCLPQSVHAMSLISPISSTSSFLSTASACRVFICFAIKSPLNVRACGACVRDTRVIIRINISDGAVVTYTLSASARTGITRLYPIPPTPFLILGLACSSSQVSPVSVRM